MRVLSATVLIVSGFVLSAWLAGYVMLYGGIVSAINHITAGAILRVLFFEAGLIPGYILVFIGLAILKKNHGNGW